VADSIYDPRYQRFLKRLKAAREAAGFTQLEVSRRMKRPSNFCHRLECGERKVQAVDLADLCLLYGVSMRSFFPETPQDRG
jgi:transcriptional regulator with XRE-family HTH domain